MLHDKFLRKIKDASLREVARRHPECVHQCVWLVKDENGPLRAGGMPRLPAGQEWPRVDGYLLAYLLAIDTAQLPEWSPLPRDAGSLLVFVGHNTCEIVMVAPGVETVETEPPLEEYASLQPTAGDDLEVVPFRLQEGLHTGMPSSWSPAEESLPKYDDDVSDGLDKLNRALQPDECFGRLFGFHEWCVGVDVAEITKYSYLQVNGFQGGWFADLDGAVAKLEQKLEKAKAKKSSAVPQPVIADVVVRACEARAAAAVIALANQLEVRTADAVEKIDAARRIIERRQRRWEKVKNVASESSHRALEQWMAAVAQLSRELEHPQKRQRGKSSKAPKDGIESNDALRDFYKELLEVLTPMQFALYQSDLKVIRKTLNAYDEKLNESAPHLTASQLSMALNWRLKGYESVVGWSRGSEDDPQSIAETIEAVKWWQAGLTNHRKHLAHWRPLLVMESSGGPYFWGDAGVAIILADQRDVAQPKLKRLAIAVDVS